MKRVILTIVTTLSFLTAFAQNSVWVTIPNIELVRTELQTLNITSVEKAFPSSKNQTLQNVYELQSNVSSSVILESLENRKDLFINPEVGPNYQTLETPNDYNVVVPNQWALDMIGSKEAWDYTKGSSVTIAITDANFYVNHEDLTGKYDYITLNNTNTNYGHGTAVSVIAGGNTNNGIGTSSVGYNSRLQLRTMSYNEMLEATYSGAKVINASWASSCFFNSYAQMVIDEVYNNGTVIVASAGNGSTCGGSSNLVYPASYDHVISVSSVGVMNNHERFMGDPNTAHQHNSMVDICAPGYDVPLTTSPGVYTTGNGTSFASPFVSGTVALMLSVNPCLTVDNIEYILKETANSDMYLINSNYQGLLGAGTLNSHLAVKMAKEFNTISGTFKTNVDCVSGDKIVSVLNLDGTSPYNYEWMNGDINETFVTSDDEFVSVQIVDSNGCRFSDSIFVGRYIKITNESLISDVKCYGMSNGEISVNISGGEFVSNVVWNNGVVGNTLTNITSGNYIFTVVDGFDCIHSDTLSVRQPEPLVSNITSVSPTITSDGSINITVDGGTLPYSYEWNNGDTTQNLNNLSEGFYELLVTDNNGCMVSENTMLYTQNTSSVSELSSNELLVYPNPSNGSVTIKTTKTDSNLSIVNINGQSVMTQSMFNGEVSVNDLSVGVYLVTVDNLTQKLIVK